MKRISIKKIWDLALEKNPFRQNSFKKAIIDREAIGQLFLHGQGIEIGALNAPLNIPEGLSVQYVDKFTLAELAQKYPEVSPSSLKKVDVISDGETLDPFLPHTLDFVIANHFLEHCQDPISAIKNMIRVLKSEGILFLTIPDKRFTFDCKRSVTPLAHLVQDHQEGPAKSKLDHLLDWARLVDNKDEATARDHVQLLLKTDYSIHYHVWTQVELLELIWFLKTNLGLLLELELFYKNGIEVIIVLRKMERNGQ